MTHSAYRRHVARRNRARMLENVGVWIALVVIALLAIPAIGLLAYIMACLRY